MGVGCGVPHGIGGFLNMMDVGSLAGGCGGDGGDGLKRLLPMLIIDVHFGVGNIVGSGAWALVGCVGSGAWALVGGGLSGA